MLKYRIKAKEYRLNAWRKFDQGVQAWASGVCKSAYVNSVVK